MFLVLMVVGVAVDCSAVGAVMAGAGSCVEGLFGAASIVVCRSRRVSDVVDRRVCGIWTFWRGELTREKGWPRGGKK